MEQPRADMPAEFLIVRERYTGGITTQLFQSLDEMSCVSGTRVGVYRLTEIKHLDVQKSVVTKRLV